MHRVYKLAYLYFVLIFVCFDVEGLDGGRFIFEEIDEQRKGERGCCLPSWWDVIIEDHYGRRDNLHIKISCDK